MRNDAVQHQACQESAEQAFQSHEHRQPCAAEDHDQHEDELRDGILVAPQEPAPNLRKGVCDSDDVDDNAQGERRPVDPSDVWLASLHHDGQQQQGAKRRQGCGDDGIGDTGMLAQAVAPHNGVGHQGVGTQHTSHEQCRCRAEAQHVAGCQQT